MNDPILAAQDAAAAAVAVAPRVTLEHIESIIVAENYFTAGDAATALEQPDTLPMRLLTFCVITLRNGFTVTGESACASPENFNEELGRQIARRQAVDKIFAFEGYLLRERLFVDAQMA